jgi:hypothetical protein
MRWVGEVARMAEKRAACRKLVGGLKEKKYIEKSKCRWVGINKMDLQEKLWRCGLYWALVNAVTNFRFP